MALNRTNRFSRGRAPDLAGHQKGTLNPFNKGDAASYNWHRQFKNPGELSEQIQKENDYYEQHSKTPLQDFQTFELANIYPRDEYNLRPRYGISENRNLTYPEYLDAYSKSKGKFASQYQDPEIQKYFNDQLAYRQQLFDRVRNIPSDKFQEFAHGYGPYSDPFDYEDEGYVAPKDAEEFLNWFDAYPLDWETLDSYLGESGY